MGGNIVVLIVGSNGLTFGSEKCATPNVGGWGHQVPSWVHLIQSILHCVGVILSSRCKELDCRGTYCRDVVEEAQGQKSIHSIAQHSQCGRPMDSNKV